MDELKLERKRQRCREATRRYRAKRAQGGSIKHAVPAPIGTRLQEIPGFSDYRADDCGNLYTRRPLGKPRFEDGPYVPWRVVPMQAHRRSGAKGHDYLTVTIAPDGKRRKRVTVHSLVALAFIGPRPSGMFVAHGMKGPLDNSPENLSYKTPAQNKADELRDGTRYAGKRHHAAKQLPQSFWDRWNAGREPKTALLREFKISRQAVYRKLQPLDLYPKNFAGSFEGLIMGGAA